MNKSPKDNHRENKEPKRPPFLIDILTRLVKEKPLGTIGGVIVLILLITGILADNLAPYAMNEIHLFDRLSPPTAQYFLGTDQLGRDILSNIIYGARISVIIGVTASLIDVLIAILIGSLTGFIGGKLDITAQRFVDAWMSFPSILITMTVMTIIGRGLPQVIAVIGITHGIRSSRVVRSAVISLKENIYVDAARAIGAPTARVLLKHIIPNIMAPIIIIFSIGMGTAILLESTMSFLGFGVPPGVPSWGSMLSEEGRQYMEIAPALAIWPGLALSVTVYSINMFGDALRDLLDPRLRGGLGRYTSTRRRQKVEAKVKH